eukprot:m.9419 g.9419  ORF g.9419 m.9419 type:complete len:369 (+) comp5409_c0_seq1:35-1141(+)
MAARVFRVLVCPGDGIGPEITKAAVRALQKATALEGVQVALEYEDVGFASLKTHGTTLREEVLEHARKVDGIILGPQSHASYPPPEQGGRNVSAGFRIGLDLFANIRPARTYAGVASNMRAGHTMDLVIVREATEGFYPDRNQYRGWGEFMPDKDTAMSLRKITRKASERIALRAFELASERRGRVTAIHKSNSFHMTDGLFLEAVRDVAKKFPQVKLDDLLVDASAAHIAREPHSFDVIVTTNLYGDILSDLASELCGSLGLGGAVMHSTTHCCAQAQHGSAPTLAGRDAANPTSMLLSTAMLLQWMGSKHSEPRLTAAGTRIDHAVRSTLASPSLHTCDLGGRASLSQFAAAVEQSITAVGVPAKL